MDDVLPPINGIHSSRDSLTARSSLLPISWFCSAKVSLLEKKAHGSCQEGFPSCCERTAPSAVLEASTTTMNGLSGCTRKRGDVKASLSCLNAWVVSVDQDRDLGMDLRSDINGAVRVL